MKSAPTITVDIKGTCHNHIAPKDESPEVKREEDLKADPPKLTVPKVRKVRKKLKRPKGPFAFMSLPVEIRRMVYKEILVMPDEICDGSWVPNRWHDPKTQPRVRQFLLTSKTIYFESMPVYFGLNTFHFHMMSSMEDFLKHTAVDHRRRIRRVSFALYGYAPARSLKLLRECVSLQYLHVRAGILSTHWGKNNMLMGAYGVNDLLKIRGIRKLEITCNDPPGYRTPGDWDCFVGALQLLKQPHTPQFLRLQEKKDYPPDKAKRMIFGKSNVITRSEAKLNKNGEESLDSLVD
ncbi:MAG: hypothetical protein LQ342_004517 [Letrouitia transgressa]|nr:MAG: hypothetical protein LQ342_004517 [Letrouitia transgressa]